MPPPPPTNCRRSPRPIRLLLERGADPNLADDRGNTALKLAASACDAKVVRVLIEAGANMAATDNFGMTAFDLAIGMSAFSGSDAPEAFIEAGYRISPEQAATLGNNYPDNPRIQEILKRATAH